MKAQLLAYAEDPHYWEAAYHREPEAFKEALAELAETDPQLPLLRFWDARLNFQPEAATASPGPVWLTLLLALGAILLIQVPHLFPVDEDVFWPRHIGFIAFGFTSLFFIAQRSPLGKWEIGGMLGIVAILIYVNLLPQPEESHVLDLVLIHTPLFLWGLMGVAYLGKKWGASQPRITFLNYSGDWVIMNGLFLLAGFLFSGITLGLFELIEVNIVEEYFDYVGLSGLAVIPLMSAYWIQRDPRLVGRIAPLIARIFSPMALVTLSAYLVAIFITGEDFYNDREALIIFNLLMIAVIALIVFSVSEHHDKKVPAWQVYIWIALVALTTVVDVIALSAIIYRIDQFGLSPNRLAVLGENVLFCIHLLLMGLTMIRFQRGPATWESLVRSITLYLPVYLVWLLVVMLIFPLIFGS